MLDRERVRDIYLEVAAAPEDERAPLLERCCGGDTALCAEVQSLMAAAARRPGLMSSPTAAPEVRLGDIEVGPGTRIGAYRLLEEIGQGGFGTVYMAEQEQPLRRRVALKVLKPGMDSRGVATRFEAERQALAMMDHPGIASVYDAGATESGRPYVVMELVQGAPITQYCDGVGMSVPERLSLFRDVCAAVQHAHQKGVIHRDLKPSNVLVAERDGRPCPKIIDFGIAKALHGRLTEHTLFTEFRQFLGTPEYMSPEQTLGAGMDVDTRSDIYSLGVLLYELLTGTTPLDPVRLRAADLVDLQRMICEAEAPRPSTRLSTLSNRAEVAACRRTEPGRLQLLLGGDLDWIVLKALEKDRSRRYESASALGEDIRRLLEHEVVSATPPRTAYRVGKFVRRHRGPVIGAALVSAALVLGVIGTSIGLMRATIDRRRAEAAEGEARQRGDHLEQVVSFQQHQLAGVDAALMGIRFRAGLLDSARVAAERSGLPPAEVNAHVTALDGLLAGCDFTGSARGALDDAILRPALAEIEQRFDGQPLVQARLLQALAVTWRDWGLLDAARVAHERVIQIRQSRLGADDPETLGSLALRGRLFLDQGNLAMAVGPVVEAWERRRRTLGADHPSTLASLDDLAMLRAAQRELPEAERLLHQALEGRRRVLGETDLATLDSMTNLGMFLLNQGRYAEAETYLREALDVCRRALPDEHHQTLTAISSMGFALQAQGRLKEAEPLYLEVLETRRRRLGDDHPDTIISINSLGLVLYEMGRPAEAEPYFRQSLAARRRVMGERHPQTLNTMTNLGFMCMRQGKLPEAEQHFRGALEGLRSVLGEDHPSTLYAMLGTGSLLRAKGDPAGAVALLAPAEGTVRSVCVGGHIGRLGDFLSTLGRARAEAGDLDLAEPNLTEAYTILSTSNRDNAARAASALADLYDTRHQREPDAGYDRLRDEWRQRLSDLYPAEQAAP